MGCLHSSLSFSVARPPIPLFCLFVVYVEGQVIGFTGAGVGSFLANGVGFGDFKGGPSSGPESPVCLQWLHIFQGTKHFSHFLFYFRSGLQQKARFQGEV